MDSEMAENGGGRQKPEEMESESDSSDSSDSDSEDMGEAGVLETYLEALEAINQNSNSYNDYIRLIEAAFNLSDLPKIREAYDLFSLAFPLAPELWLRRLKVEISLAGTPEQVSALDELFKKALSDYFSPDIAILFAQTTNSKDIWTGYLLKHAFDCLRGAALFKVWREKNPECQFDLFKLELELPIADTEDSFAAAKSLYGQHESWKAIEESYLRSRKLVKELLPFEKKLGGCEDYQEKAQIYRSYIEKAKTVCPAMVRSIYERLVADCCLDYTAWLDYLDYVHELDPDQKQEGFEDPVELVSRGTRNCCWSHQLYVEKIRVLESAGRKSEVQAVIEQACAAGFENPDALVSIWLEYLTFLTRTSNFQDTDERELLRKNFQFCWDNLGETWGALADTQCKILQFWGRLEYGKLGNAVKGRDLWFTVMESADNSTKAVLWTEFAHLEMQRGLEPARKVYRKAVASPNVDDIENLASSWIQFERCYGSLKQLKAAQEYCFPVLRQALLRKRQDKKRKPDEPKGKPEPAKTKPVKRKDPEEEKATSSKKKKVDVEPLQAIKNVQIRDPAKDKMCVFLSNLQYDISEEDLVASFPELAIKSIEIKKNQAGKSRGYCYVELECEAEVAKALTFDRRLIRDRPVYISRINREKEARQLQRPKYPEVMERNKLFIKGLPFETTKEELEKLFQPFGKISDVRIVTYRSGKSKGLAYVDFESESSASAAILKLDQHEIDGHKITVAISAPPPKDKQVPVIQKRDPGTAKPRLSLIPTSVQRKVGEGMDKGPAVAPKSNADFRQLFLNKK